MLQNSPGIPPELTR